MIIQFGISNLLSYEQPVAVQFSTNSKETSFDDTDTFGNRFYKCLRYLPVFGSNASGKSNLIKAINFFSFAVANNAVLSKSTNMYCKTNKKNADLPSSLEMVIVVDDVFYQYGFSAILKTGTIVDEYLNKITPSTKASNVIFDRSHREINLNLSAKNKKSVQFRLEDSIGRNELFLTNIGSYLKMNPDETGELFIFYTIYDYIVDKIVVINKNSQSTYLFLTETIDDAFLDSLNEFDFNIKEIDKEKVDSDSLLSMLSPDIVSRIKSAIYSVNSSFYTVIISGKLYSFKNSDNGIVAHRIYFKHYNSDNEFDYSEESDGTIRIMDFIPLLFYKGECTVFIDEIEQSLSSDLIIKFFKLLRANKKEIQLLFTTHQDRLFDHKYFRFDEMYIVEKNQNGASFLKRFSQFSNQDKADNITAKFIDGRYGGRPKIF